MAIVVWILCDNPVPYGTCGNKAYAVADTVTAAVDEVEADGWYVAAPRAGQPRRVLCPGHSGRSR